LKQSIRNQLPGTIKLIVSDKVVSEIVIETDAGEVTAIISTHSVEEMKLQVGDKVFALIKATNVSLRRE
jgi:molybdopterin-binding protein